MEGKQERQRLRLNIDVIISLAEQRELLANKCADCADCSESESSSALI